MKRQAELLGIARSTVCYKSAADPYNLELMHLIDEMYTKTPFMAPGESEKHSREEATLWTERKYKDS